LDWSRDNSTDFYLLSALARYLIVIAAMQAQSEQLFSSVGQILKKID